MRLLWRLDAEKANRVAMARDSIAGALRTKRR
jgi:hypothetical protein